MMEWQFGLKGKLLNLKSKKPLKKAAFADASSTPAISKTKNDYLINDNDP
ncbi:hypothetical protein Q674_13635 [Acinetobacter sp. COS3]|nr:hypothetical protein Q674_13635 [Acinetobacter sp. COS3]